MEASTNRRMPLSRRRKEEIFIGLSGAFFVAGFTATVFFGLIHDAVFGLDKAPGHSDPIWLSILGWSAMSLGTLGLVMAAGFVVYLFVRYLVLNGAENDDELFRI